MNAIIQTSAQTILDGGQLTAERIGRLSMASFEDLDDLLYWANRIRIRFFGKRIRICSIVPGRLGGCSQDCAFCAQSVRYDTAINKTRRC